MNVNNMRYLLLLLPLTLLAQIPGTFRVTGPVAPTATNSNYGASIPVYNYGGFLTGLGSLSELQNLNIYPLARRHAGQIAVLTNGVAYQLGSDLTTWTTYAGWTNFQTVNNFTINTNLVVGNTATVVGEAVIDGINIGNGPGNQTSNTRVGRGAFNGTALGQHNVVIGNNAAPVATTPTNNVIIGSNAGLSITSSDNNVVVGQDAYRAATVGSSNPADPSYTTGAHNNIAIGRAAMYSMYDGRNNFAAGTFSMYPTTNGDFNVALGVHSLNSFISGDANTSIGESSLYNNTTGFYNTALGAGAGYYSSSSSQRNVYLGFNAGPSSLTTENNKLYIDNAPGTPLIGGDFTANTVTISGRLGLGVAPLPTHGLYTKDLGGLIVENPSNQDTTIALLATGAAYASFGYNGGATTNPYGAPSGSVYFGTPQQKDVWISSAGGRLKVSTPNGTNTWITVTTLPTSATGLPSGTLWNDAGTLKVAP